MSVEHGGIDYEAVLADLERRRVELDGAISFIRNQILKQPPQGGPTPPAGAPKPPAPHQQTPREIRSDTFFGMKAPEAIKTYLRIMKAPQPVGDIANALKAGGFITTAKDLYANLYTALLRMQRNDEVAKVGDGKWGLAEWYTGRVRPKPKDAADAKSDGKVGRAEKGDALADDAGPNLESSEAGNEAETAA